MARSYGKVGGRRSGSAAWQWVIIGLILGIGCSAIVVLAGLTVGVLTLDADAVGAIGAPTGTAVVVVVTATNDPAQPTAMPVVVTATLAPASSTPAAPQVQLVAPTATPLTPTVDTAAVQVEPSTTPTQILPPSPANGTGASAGVTIPGTLADQVSPLVRVDGGNFTMGTTVQEVAEAVRLCVSRDAASCVAADAEDSSPAHQVTIDPFQIEVTEVTFGQFVAFLNWRRSSSGGTWNHQNGCDGFPCVATRNEDEKSNVIFDSANYDFPPVLQDFPIINVTWYGARAFCAAIGRRLPTEAEWERTARGNDGRIYPWGNDWDAIYAKTSRPVVDAAQAGAVAVGSYPAGISVFGALDMTGNVAEWVSDWYSPTYYSQPEASGLNPTGPVAGVDKVIRGGSWDAVPFFGRSVHRQNRQPNEQFPWLGFRCAADIDATTGVQGSNLLPEANAGTPDPATLGVNVPGAESDSGAAPTLPPAPTPVSGG